MYLVYTFLHFLRYMNISLALSYRAKYTFTLCHLSAMYSDILSLYSIREFTLNYIVNSHITLTSAAVAVRVYIHVSQITLAIIYQL